MRDADVRGAVHRLLAAMHEGDDNTRIVEEMGVWSGSARIDIAVINGQLTGYELKSDRDTLDRLPSQAELYNRVFDRVVLVVGERHASKAARAVPRWWGVTIAKGQNGEVSLTEKRASAANPRPDPLMLARLLWKSEALDLLVLHDLAKGWRSKPAEEMHRRLASELPIEILAAGVRSALKRRDGWLRKPVRD